MALGTAAFLAAAVLFWHFLPPSTKSDNVALEEPADKATIVGPVLLRWSYNKPDESNLQFELSIAQAGHPDVRTLMRRNSFHLVDAPGVIRWKVRPVWKKLNGLEERGEWSEERLFTSYPSSLHRLLLTRTINVGTAESEGIYVRDEGGENTTNETLGRKLLDPSDADHLRLYRGSGAYDSMFSDLLTHHVEGLLMDKPYALEKIAEFSKSQVAEFFTWDVTDQIVPQLEPEKSDLHFGALTCPYCRRSMRNWIC
jgi:hypothetical protein